MYTTICTDENGETVKKFTTNTIKDANARLQADSSRMAYKKISEYVKAVTTDKLGNVKQTRVRV